MTSLGRKKMAVQLISKQKSGGTATQIFRSDKGRSKGRSKGERSRVGTEK